MKGQEGFVVGSVIVVLIAAVLVLVGSAVYGQVANTVPHDKSYINESLCTDSCAHSTLYALANTPITDTASDLVCYVNVSSGATRLLSASDTNGYQNIGSNYINLTNSSAAPTGDYTYRNVSCSYTYDWASADQETFWENSTTSGFEGLAMLSVFIIVLSAVMLIAIVKMLTNA